MTNPASTVTDHGREAYAPQPERRGTALCLSGGGYRAALFHLGALRRLNELGVFSDLDTVCSVSGGSILAAHLATQIPDWPQAGEAIPDWDQTVRASFWRFTTNNIRTGPILRRLMPWNWRTGAVEALADQYRSKLTGLALTRMPARPRYVMCATDMTFGVNWVFDTGRTQGLVERMGDYQVGYQAPLPAWPLARAVAASSCFPPVFNPMRLGLDPTQLAGGDYDQPDRPGLVGRLSVSDGGVYDNLGLEPVWKNHATVLVSDGGAVFEAEQDTGLIWRVQRYISIAGRQGQAMRKRWLISNFIAGEMDGTYWGIGSDTANYDYQGDHYPEDLVDEVISEIRTDLDRFSDAEQQVLENHGYIMAEAAIQRHAPNTIRNPVPFHIPNPEWMDPGRVRHALADSHKRRLLGRR